MFLNSEALQKKIDFNSKYLPPKAKIDITQRYSIMNLIHNRGYHLSEQQRKIMLANRHINPRYNNMNSGAPSIINSINTLNENMNNTQLRKPTLLPQYGKYQTLLNIVYAQVILFKSFGNIAVFDMSSNKYQMAKKGALINEDNAINNIINNDIFFIFHVDPNNNILAQELMSLSKTSISDKLVVDKYNTMNNIKAVNPYISPTMSTPYSTNIKNIKDIPNVYNPKDLDLDIDYDIADDFSSFDYKGTIYKFDSFMSSFIKLYGSLMEDLKQINININIWTDASKEKAEWYNSMIKKKIISLIYENIIKFIKNIKEMKNSILQSYININFINNSVDTVTNSFKLTDDEISKIASKYQGEIVDVIMYNEKEKKEVNINFITNEYIAIKKLINYIDNLKKKINDIIDSEIKNYKNFIESKIKKKEKVQDPNIINIPSEKTDIIKKQEEEADKEEKRIIQSGGLFQFSDKYDYNEAKKEGLTDNEIQSHQCDFCVDHVDLSNNTNTTIFKTLKMFVKHKKSKNHNERIKLNKLSTSTTEQINISDVSDTEYEKTKEEIKEEKKEEKKITNKFFEKLKLPNYLVTFVNQNKDKKFDISNANEIIGDMEKIQNFVFTENVFNTIFNTNDISNVLNNVNIDNIKMMKTSNNLILTKFKKITNPNNNKLKKIKEIEEFRTILLKKLKKTSRKKY